MTETNDAYLRHIEHVLQSIRGYALEHKLTPEELRDMFRGAIVERAQQREAAGRPASAA